MYTIESVEHHFVMRGKGYRKNWEIHLNKQGKFHVLLPRLLHHDVPPRIMRFLGNIVFDSLSEAIDYTGYFEEEFREAKKHKHILH